MRLHGNNGFILLTATCRSATKQPGRTVALPLQQWLRERATILRYTYIAYVYFHPHIFEYSEPGVFSV
jgi:hypothetical protein